MISGNRQLTVSQRLVLYSILAVLMLVVTFPFYWMLVTSLKTGRGVYDVQHMLIPTELTLASWISLFAQTDVLHWVWVTAVLSSVSTAIALVIGVCAAFSLTYFRFPGRKAIGFSVFLSYVIPQAMLFIPLFLLLNNLHLVNTFVGLVLADQTITVPFCTWLLMGYFRTLPNEIKDAALIDGCTPGRVLWHIILPLAGPGVVTAAIFSFTNVWNEFLYATALVTGTELKTITLGVAGFMVADVFIWGQLMAAAIVSTVPMLILFAVLQKYVVQGLTAGSIKG